MINELIRLVKNVDLMHSFGKTTLIVEAVTMHVKKSNIFLVHASYNFLLFFVKISVFYKKIAGK